MEGGSSQIQSHMYIIMHGHNMVAHQIYYPKVAIVISVVKCNVKGATYCRELVHGETHLTMYHSMHLIMILNVAE